MDSFLTALGAFILAILAKVLATYVIRFNDWLCTRLKSKAQKNNRKL